MAVYLLTWNPNSWEWPDIGEYATAVAQGSAPTLRWSCGNTKSIPLGARVFLLRQGVEPKGLVASGWVTETTFKAPHWDVERAEGGDLANFVEFAADVLRDPDSLPPLDVRRFHVGPLSQVNWSTPASGIRIPPEAAVDLEDVWLRHCGPSSRPVGTEDRELIGLEGQVRRRMVAHRSRERLLRQRKIEQARRESPDGRLRCEVPGCGFDFEATYGHLGKGYAHVHHLLALSKATGPVQTRLDDLAIVCPNCHAMIHIGGANRPLKGLIQGE